MIEDDADDRERVEAEALAEALEGSARQGAPPDDALEAAAFLRYSGHEGELATERAEAILGDVLRDAPARRPRERVRPWYLQRLPWLVGLASAGAVAVFLLTRPAKERPAVTRRGPTPASILPAAPATLLKAQIALAKGSTRDGAHFDAFDAEMRAYRSAVLRALEARYPARLSVLEDDFRRRPR